MNFNSHAHVERDYVCTKHFVNFFISTHTLTWSVTDETVDRVLEFYDFNSHAHVERDVSLK